MARGQLDEWVELVKECRYLPETDLRALCDLVVDILVEESNVQPVASPVTVAPIMDLHMLIASLSLGLSLSLSDSLCFCINSNFTFT